jgi:hypothetical protein
MSAWLAGKLYAGIYNHYTKRHAPTENAEIGDLLRAEPKPTLT